MRKYLLIVISLMSFGKMNSQSSLSSLLSKYNSGKAPYISVNELRMHQLNDDVIILDARERIEFQVSHIKNAVLVGYDHFDEAVLENFNKDEKIVVYCSIGIRSENIADRLIKSGFKNVFNLYGGIFEWKNEDFPVVDLHGKETDKVHIYSKRWGTWLKKGEKIY